MAKEDTGVPLLSVVVVGLNEAERIGQCIDSIKAAVGDIPDTEIVYVDSGSLDDTVSIALSKGVRVFQLGKTQLPSPAAGRYVGSVVTRGRFIMFVDGDTQIAPGWSESAIELMKHDTSVVMFSGTFRASHGSQKGSLARVGDLGVIKPVYRTSGSNAPILSRDALEAVGNWNPFVRCREEEDLAIRLRHYIPGSQVCQSNRCTVETPKCPIFVPGELFRRWKRGFVKGPGQILRNAIAHGYWRACVNVAKPMLLAVTFLVGLSVTIALNFWWQFLLLFFSVSFLRAVVTRKFVRFATVFYSLLVGFYSLWEFLTVPPRTASDYVRDFEEIRANHKKEVGIRDD